MEWGITYSIIYPQIKGTCFQAQIIAKCFVSFYPCHQGFFVSSFVTLYDDINTCGGIASEAGGRRQGRA